MRLANRTFLHPLISSLCLVTLGLHTPSSLARSSGEEPGPCDCCFAGGIRFSVDIGSNAEVSMRLPTGTGGLDPGDVYTGWGSPAAVVCPAVGGADSPFFDDAALFIFSGDPAPDPPSSPVMDAVPIGSGCDPDVCHEEYFDLDAYEQLSFDLADYGLELGTPLQTPILRSDIAGLDANSCAQAQHLMLSYDDDQSGSWAGPMGIPVDSPSPLGSTFGTTAGFDEIIGLTVSVSGGIASVLDVFAIADEERVHPLLAPNPTAGDESEDDDVDALDYCLGDEYRLYSVDHEANFQLGPGVIYQEGVSGPGGDPFPFISPLVHLGLANFDIDIDAIEFVWTVSPDGSEEWLTLLYSVDDDDPYTPGVDESGSLHPGTIYASYLTGSSFEFLPHTDLASEDIDAIAGAHFTTKIEETCLIAGQFNGDIIEVDPETGGTTTLGNIGHSIGGVASSRSNRVFTMWDNDELIEVNLGDPASSTVHTLTAPSGVGACRAMAINCDGNFFVVLDATPDDMLYFIHAPTLTYFTVGPIGGYTDITGLAFDECDDLYAVSTSAGILELNPFDGSVVGGLGTCAVPPDARRTIEFDCDGTLFGADDDLVEIEPYAGCCDSTVLWTGILSTTSGLAVVKKTDECPWDLDDDGQVGVTDLLIILGGFPGTYDIDDLLALLAAWGPC